MFRHSCLFYKKNCVAFCRFTFVLLVWSRLIWFEMHCSRWIIFFTVVFSLSQFCLYFCWYSNSARELYLYYLNRQKRERKNVFIMDDILTRDFRETCYIKYLLAMMYDSKTLASTHYGINYWFSNATITDRLVL